MDKLKSGIIFSDHIFLGIGDSHAQMLAHLKLSASPALHQAFVQATLSPPDGDVFSPIDTWEFSVAQSVVPHWFVFWREKQRFIKAVRQWKKAHVFEGIYALPLRCEEADFYYLKHCRNAQIVAQGNAQIRAFDCATLSAYGTATVEACGGSVVNAYGNSKIEACGSTVVNAYENAQVEAYGHARVSLHHRATVEAYSHASVTVHGGAVEAFGYARVTALAPARIVAAGCTTVLVPHGSCCKASSILLLEQASVKIQANAVGSIPTERIGANGVQ